MVKIQMANPNAHTNVPFLTQMTVLVGNLGFQSMTDQYETPCNYFMVLYKIRENPVLLASLWKSLSISGSALFRMRENC